MHPGRMWENEIKLINQRKLSLKNQGVTAASLQPNKELLRLAQDAKSNATDEPVKDLRKELLKQI